MRRLRPIGIFFIVASLIIVHCSFCFAMRPLYTEDAWVVAPGKAVIESGVLFLTTRENKGVKELITSLKYGLASDFDLTLDLPYVSHFSSEGNYDGMSYGTFKLKYNFNNFLGIEGSSFLFGYQVDSEDQSISSDPNAHDITAMYIYSLGLDTVSCNLNFGYIYDDEPGGLPREDFILYNGSLIKPITENMNLMGECQFSINTYTGSRYGETAVGFNYEYSKDLIFDMALGCGLNANSSSSNLVFGLTYIFNLLGRNE